MTKRTQDELLDHPAAFAQGTATFALLFTRWMDTNGWSHPVMVSLAKAAMGGVGWLHSSQISALRHNKITSPGPRTFVAIERLNYYVHRYATTRALIPGTSSSNFYAEAWAVTENGKPPSLGWWVEVFCGQRVPKDIDLHQSFFTELQAAEMSERWGALIRRLLRDKDIDLITDLDSVLRNHYPARDSERLKALQDVITARATWSSEQLVNELPAIAALTAQIGGPSTEDELLHSLKS